MNKIPYVSRLSKNTRRETESLMLMVTPRIIIQEEEEELLDFLATSGLSTHGVGEESGWRKKPAQPRNESIDYLEKSPRLCRKFWSPRS